MEKNCKSGAIYDAIYSFKDYATECATIEQIMKANVKGKSSPITLLDVACGTGKHLELLKEKFAVEGLDLDESGNLSVARQRLPNIPLHAGDMASFSLSGSTFDVITCLFSSIGYVCTVPRLNATIANFAKHLASDGVIIVEPWFEATSFTPGTIHARFVDEPDLKIARMHVSTVRDGVSILDFHYMVATKHGIETLREVHELGLFSHDQYLEAFKAAGLQVEHDMKGWGRGLYIAKRPE